MKYVDMTDPKQNPIFKAIEIKCLGETVLNVSYKRFIYFNLEWNKVNLSHVLQHLAHIHMYTVYAW